MATNAAIIMADHEGDATVSPEETMGFDDDTFKGEETITNISIFLWNLTLEGIATL